MKKKAIIISLIMLCLIFGIIIFPIKIVVNADYQNPTYIPEISINPATIYDNSNFVENDYTIYGPAYESFDFLQDDFYVDIEFNGTYGFTNYNYLTKNIELENEYSTNYSVAEPFYYLAQDSEQDIVKNRIKLKGLGSCYLNYSGYFDVELKTDVISRYYFKGKLLINVVSYGVESLSFNKESVSYTYLDEMSNLESVKVLDKYSALINNNPNLSNYNRNRIYWQTEKEISKGNVFELYDQQVTDKFLILGYDNTSWLKEEELSDYSDLKVTIFNNLPTNNADTILNKLWWLFDIIVIALIICFGILYTKWQEKTSLENTIFHIDKYYSIVQKLIDLINKEKRKKSKEKRLLIQAYFELLFAYQSLENATKEEYYELNECLFPIKNSYIKLSIFRKNIESFNDKKLLKLFENIKSSITPSYVLIQKTLAKEARKEANLEKEKFVKEKDVFKSKKTNKITMESLYNELNDEELNIIENLKQKKSKNQKEKYDESKSETQNKPTKNNVSDSDAEIVVAKVIYDIINNTNKDD